MRIPRARRSKIKLKFHRYGKITFTVSKEKIFHSNFLFGEVSITFSPPQNLEEILAKAGSWGLVRERGYRLTGT